MQKSSSGSSVSPFGFVGAEGYQQDSDSGLMLLGHRYYDSSTGRFLTRDPINDGSNWYDYVGNNPLEIIDDSGLGPIPGITKPPIKLPPGESWRWVPSPGSSRRGKCVGSPPSKGGDGGQPSASWDDKYKHWDYDDGDGKRSRYGKMGRSCHLASIAVLEITRLFSFTLRFRL